MMYKLLTEKGTAPYADVPLREDVWLPKIEDLKLCVSGYHTTTEEFLVDWLTIGTLHPVKTRGETISGGTKSAHQQIRILPAIGRITPEVCAQFANFCASQAAQYAEQAAQSAARSARHAQYTAHYAARAAAAGYAHYAARDAAGYAQCAARSAQDAARAVQAAQDDTRSAQDAARSAQAARDDTRSEQGAKLLELAKAAL